MGCWLFFVPFVLAAGGPAPAHFRQGYLSATAVAACPPSSLGGSMQVLVEFAIGADGTFTAEAVSGTGGAFRDAALAAARKWRFRSTGAPAVAYVVFGFRPPP